MNTRLLLPAMLILSLAACAAETNGDAAADAATAAAETEAVYGDEAPVAIAPEAADDHGHAHDGEDAHAHEDEAHDHGDGSEPHAH